VSAFADLEVVEKGILVVFEGCGIFVVEGIDRGDGHGPIKKVFTEELAQEGKTLLAFIIFRIFHQSAGGLIVQPSICYSHAFIFELYRSISKADREGFDCNIACTVPQYCRTFLCKSACVPSPLK